MPCQRGLLRSREPGRDGERAVAQVVLNRVRHPAFPASVCGVVYQGSTRATGCQFTFTCDGSLYRQPDADGWRRATGRRSRALAARLCARRLGDPLSRRLRRSLLGLDPCQECGRRSAHFLPLGGRMGSAGGFQRRLCRPRAQRAALRNAALAAEAATAGQQGSVAEAIDRTFRARRRSSSPRRCVATSGSRCGSTWSRRKAADEATHEDYAEKFEASDNLKYALSSETERRRTKSRSARPLRAAADLRQRPRRAALARARRGSAAQAPIRPAAGSGRAGRRSPDNRLTAPMPLLHCRPVTASSLNGP